MYEGVAAGSAKEGMRGRDGWVEGEAIREGERRRETDRYETQEGRKRVR